MKWIKCSDELPKRREDVLLFFDGQIGYGWLESNESEYPFFYCQQRGVSPEKVTHWMAYPEPPNEKDASLEKGKIEP